MDEVECQSENTSLELDCQYASPCQVQTEICVFGLAFHFVRFLNSPTPYHRWNTSPITCPFAFAGAGIPNKRLNVGAMSI